MNLDKGCMFVDGQSITAGRWHEIDALRGLAVLLMVFSHALRWTYAGDPLELISICGNLTPGDTATPMFYLAAGLSLYFSLHSSLHRGFDLSNLQKRYARRLGKLFFIGVTMSLVWGVLQAQAITLLIIASFTIAMARFKLSQRLRFFFPAIIIAALLVHLLLARLVLPPFWQEILAGQFPLFAILAINATGFYLASFLQSSAFFRVLAGLGVALTGTAIMLGEQGVLVERHGASLAFLLLGAGLSCVLLAVFHNRLMQRTIAFQYLVRIGNDALFLFVFHYVAFFLPLHFLGILGTMDTGAASLYAVGVVTAVTVTAKLRQHSTFLVYDLLDLIFVTARTYLLWTPAQLQKVSAQRHSPYAGGAEPMRFSR